MELVKYIFTIPGVKFFLSGRLSQDTLENYFGCQRQRGGRHENPNVSEFCKNRQALKVVNSVCGSVSKGNCRGKKQSVDVELESRPLRKRCKAKFRTQKTYSKLIKPPRVFKSNAKSKIMKKPTVPRKALFKAQSVSAHNIATNKISSKDVTILNDGPVMLAKYSVTDTSPDSSMGLPSNHTSQGSYSNNHMDNSRVQHQTSLEIDIVKLDGKERQAKSQVSEQPLLDETACSTEGEMISKALGPGSPEEELSKCFSISIRRQDIWTLKCSGWLNDQVRKLFDLNTLMLLFPLLL